MIDNVLNRARFEVNKQHIAVVSPYRQKLLIRRYPGRTGVLSPSFEDPDVPRLFAIPNLQLASVLYNHFFAAREGSYGHRVLNITLDVPHHLSAVDVPYVPAARSGSRKEPATVR